MNEATYKELCKPHERAMRQLLLDFEYFQEDVPGITVLAIEHRLKTLHSAEAKSRQKNIPIHQLCDLAGLRIVAGTSQVVEAVRRFFSRQKCSKDLVIEEDAPVTYSSGYRSHHIVVKYEPRYTRSPYDARVEVQIPTVFQHAFNQLSRTWVYKAERSFTTDWQTRFRELARRLDELNQLAGDLHADVILSAESREPDAPLSPFSYQVFVHEEFGELESMENSVDTVTLLGRFGISTNRDLLHYFRNPRLHRLWEEFTKYAELGDNLAQSLTSKKTVFWSLMGLNLADHAEEILGRIRKDHADANR